MLTATILCVDDEETHLAIRKMLLESAGYRVLTAVSGENALKIFESQTVQLAVLDYSMARMNGLELARELKRRRSETLVLMLSGHVIPSSETLGIVDITMQKAEDPRQLLAAISRLLA